MSQKPTNPAPGGAAGLGRHPQRHASDVPGFKPPAPQAQAQSRLRRQRLVERLHRLGPAPLGYFLDEIERGAPLVPTLETYAALPADFIGAYGGDKFAPSLWAIEGGRR
jgi:hypothetical protein